MRDKFWRLLKPDIMKNLFLLLLLLPLLACAPTKLIFQANEAKKDLAIIKKNTALFSAALMRQDYDFVVNAYTDDAKIFPNGTKILTGKEAIRQYWTPPAGSNRKTTYHKVTTEEVKVLGNEAYDLWLL